MLIKKDNIYRNIDENRLHEYTTIGYKPVEDAPPTVAEDIKAIDKMNADELTQKAEELGVDISAAKTNKEKAQIILAYIENSDNAKE